MRIGEFVKLLNTTKDTVRHYEDLHLISPKWEETYKCYGEKDVLDFKVIVECKTMGLSLKDIQFLFDLKQASQCGDKQFMTQVLNKLKNHIEVLKMEEDEIHNRRIKLQGEINNIELVLKSI